MTEKIELNPPRENRLEIYQINSAKQIENPGSREPSNPRRIPELDGFRALAIILVIACHYEVFSRQFWGLPQFGWVGVDLFFALSGYLITSVLLSLKGKERAFGKFYSRRFRRILPPYLAFFLLVFAATAATGDLSLFRPHELIKNAFFLQAFGQTHEMFQRMFSDGWRFGSVIHSQLPRMSSGLTGSIAGSKGVLWSLSIEEYFYLLWAPILLWFSKRAVFIFGIAICLAEFYMRWAVFEGVTSYFSIFYRFDSLIFGAFAALAIGSSVPRKHLVWISSGCICLSCLVLAEVLIPMGNIIGAEIRSDHVFMVFGLPALSLLLSSLIVVIVIHRGSLLLAPLRMRALGFIGRISYTLYLLHGFVYLCFLHRFPATLTISIASLTVAVGLSWLSWTYYEQPVLDGTWDSRLHNLGSSLQKVRRQLSGKYLNREAI